jgi:magnesium transporter
MRESFSNPSEKSGLPPGSLVHVGDILETITRMSLIDYSKDHLEERQIQYVDDILEYKDSTTVTWVIIEGLTDIDAIEKMGQLFGIHPLVLEDILNTHQRPKFEEYDDYLYVVLKSLVKDPDAFAINYEQISLLVIKNFIFIFREKTDDLFLPIRQRLKNSKGHIRNLGSDHLMYTILDTIVDQNFVLIDALDESVTMLEDELFSEPTHETLNALQKLKRETISIRRNISPIRELLAGLLRSESPLIKESTHIYLRDVSDHTIRALESIETYRDIFSSLVEIYISSVSNKMNEAMKVLTIFAAIFIPLTFLAGIYGMNFEYMPELKWKWGYPTIWSLFIAIPVVLLVYFKKKKWL